MIQFNCPQCGELLEDDDSMAGKDDCCPQCGQALSVPALSKNTKGTKSQAMPILCSIGLHAWDGSKCRRCGHVRSRICFCPGCDTQGTFDPHRYERVIHTITARKPSFEIEGRRSWKIRCPRCGKKEHISEARYVSGEFEWSLSSNERDSGHYTLMDCHLCGGKLTRMQYPMGGDERCFQCGPSLSHNQTESLLEASRPRRAVRFCPACKDYRAEEYSTFLLKMFDYPFFEAEVSKRCKCKCGYPSLVGRFHESVYSWTVEYKDGSCSCWVFEDCEECGGVLSRRHRDDYDASCFGTCAKGSG